MAREPGFVFEYIKQVELLADDVLRDRRDIIEYNKKRDKTREASRALKKPESEDVMNENHAWMCCGNLFINFTKQEADRILEKDFNVHDKEISKLQKGLKEKVNKLYDAENKPELKGYDLVPLTKEEKQSLFNLIGKD